MTMRNNCHSRFPFFLLPLACREGAVYNNPEDFTAYICKTALEYNTPLRIHFAGKQVKE